jgi:hypothetical protein
MGAANPYPNAMTEGTMSHMAALALRVPAVSESGCLGTLDFRRYAVPQDPRTPLIYRCRQCGTILALDPNNLATLWTEAMTDPVTWTLPPPEEAK